MQPLDYPALYRSADELSLLSQHRFFRVLSLHLLLLIAAAVLSVINSPIWEAAVTQVLIFLGALGCSVYLSAMRPDRYWYASRAVAESIKTLTWRFITRAEPFDTDEDIAASHFRQTLKAVIEQNRDVVRQLSTHLDGFQITDAMSAMRAAPMAERLRVYVTMRVTEQLIWYAKKSASNRKTSNLFFGMLITVNAIAVALAIARVKFPVAPFWPTPILIALAASLLSWMQAKRFSELASSYALAAHEISLIREQANSISSDSKLSKFVW
ncbi:MAG TPA: DUF4231 domain-containing protein [Nitrospiraceae bacterium]|nr:DUF4231 domain-containing protein [Nitrospiraceae bacterium]